MRKENSKKSDEYIEDGTAVLKNRRVNVWELFNYCKQKGFNSEQLTLEVLGVQGL